MGAAERPDGASDEFEPVQGTKRRAERIIRHPHDQAQSLDRVAEEGESGATPLVEIVTVAGWAIPFVALIAAFILGVYYAGRRWG